MPLGKPGWSPTASHFPKRCKHGLLSLYSSALHHQSFHGGALRPQTVVDAGGPHDPLTRPKARRFVADGDKTFTVDADHIHFEWRGMLNDPRAGCKLHA